MELFREVFKQLKNESPVNLLTLREASSYNTRRDALGLLPVKYSRTSTKAKSLETRLRKAYNWLKERNLMPPNFKELSRSQINVPLKNS